MDCPVCNGNGMKGGGMCQACRGTGSMMGNPRFVAFILLTLGLILCIMVSTCQPALPVALALAS